MKKEFISHSPNETEVFAEKLAKEFVGGEVLAFTGDLGMGKTCFVRGLAKGLGFNGEVSSPTFAIVNSYFGGRLDLYHFDMYRISGWDDLYTTGFFEAVDSKNVVAVEWSENISAALNDNTIFVEITRIDDTTRNISISGGKD